MVKSFFISRDSCPGCKSTAAKILYQVPYSDKNIVSYLTKFYGEQGKIELEFLNGAEFILQECEHCSLVFQKQIPNDFLMQKLYEEWIDPRLVLANEKETFDLAYYARYSQEVGMIVASLKKKPNELSFFDFGMGWGNWLKMVNAFGVNAFGAELSQSRIEHARKYGIEIIDLDQLGEIKFDFINTEQVFEHIPAPLETLKFLRSGLKSGGIIKISVPDGSDIKKRLKIADWSAPKYTPNSLNAVSPLEHINCFNFDAIVKMAKHAGLRQIKMPLAAQYGFMDNNNSVTAVVKNLVRPLLRNFGKGTYLFFTPE